MAHHRASFARAAAERMQSTGRGSFRATQILAHGQAPLTFRPLDDSHRSGIIRATISAWLVARCATFAGRPIPKWCRWGWWEPDGSRLNVTRIL